MGLSLNPLSWTPSNLAEEAVEFVTGSEAAGDAAGLFMAGATGDVKGMAEQGMDLGENVIAGATSFVGGVYDAAKDAVKKFSNPGGVKSPSQSECTCGGYDAGEANGPNDTGAVGKARADSPDEAQQRSELNSILNDPTASLEDKVFALLMFLNQKKEGDVEGLVKKMAGKEKGKVGAGKAGEAGAAEKDTEKEDSFKLQKAQGELSQLNNLTTTMMQSFKQMKDSVIQNIGR